VINQTSKIEQNRENNQSLQFTLFLVLYIYFQFGLFFILSLRFCTSSNKKPTTRHILSSLLQSKKVTAGGV